MQHPIPSVHTVPGGFIVVTPLDSRFVVESFVRSVDNAGSTISSPLLYATVTAGLVAGEIEEHKAEIERSNRYAFDVTRL